MSSNKAFGQIDLSQAAIEDICEKEINIAWNKSYYENLEEWAKLYLQDPK
jgi:hypothetical protein